MHTYIHACMHTYTHTYAFIFYGFHLSFTFITPLTPPLNGVYWNVPADRIMCTEKSLLTEDSAPENPNWLNICTIKSLLTEYSVLGHLYQPNILY